MRVSIAICISDNKWHEKIASSIDKYANQYNLVYEFVNIDAHDWMETISDFDYIVWKPSNMGVEAASYLKEKIYFIETYMKKRIFPNYASVWHFESKVAQSYLIKQFNIPSPNTFVTFSYSDAFNLLKDTAYPIVMKKSFGAGSVNVRLVRTQKKALFVIKKMLSRQLLKGENRMRWILPYNIFYAINYYIDSKILKTNLHACYWQEFIPGNQKDLRITVVGARYAVAFWRNNRKNDFRASGSGNIDYESPIPVNVIKYCFELSEAMSFDSMAYDIVFDKNNAFKIIEMSYGFIDTAIFNAGSYYECDCNGSISRIDGKIWPQELWVKSIINIISNKNK